MYTDGPPSPEDIEYIPVFYQEISDIMRGYGDCENPLRESVILVEQIVIQQMSSILNDVINLAIDHRGTPEPCLNDFEHMMRQHPKRIYRLRKHLRDLELRRRYQAMLSGQPLILNEEDANHTEPDGVPISERHDEERVRRLFRADRISLMLNGAQYFTYNEARRTSFYCRNSNTIREKLKTMLEPPPDAKISMRVYNILGWLVHETIAVIVDYAILTRLHSGNRSVEPNNRISSGVTYNMKNVCPEVTQGRALDGVKPVSTREIQEAIRRFNMGYYRPLGRQRNLMNREHNIPYLAI